MTDRLDPERTDPDSVRTDLVTGRGLAWLLTVGGAIALVASFILTEDKFKLATDKNFTPNCNVNAFVSCGSVMESDQAAAFGFPNSFIGMMAFSVVVTLGVLLVARTPLPAFVWGGLQVGVVFGIGMVTWLQYQSIYQLERLCPYCMVVWAMTFPIFWYVTLRNLRSVAPGNAVTRVLSDWHVLVLCLWYVAVLAAIWFEFGSRLWA